MEKETQISALVSAATRRASTASCCVASCSRPARSAAENARSTTACRSFSAIAPKYASRAVKAATSSTKRRTVPEPATMYIRATRSRMVRPVSAESPATATLRDAIRARLSRYRSRSAVACARRCSAASRAAVAWLSSSRNRLLRVNRPGARSGTSTHCHALPSSPVVSSRAARRTWYLPGSSVAAFWYGRPCFSTCS